MPARIHSFPSLNAFRFLRLTPDTPVLKSSFVRGFNVCWCGYLLGLEEEDCTVPEVEVDEVFSLVCYE